MLALLMPATFLRAAELVFSPASASYAAESDFSIKVDIDPGSDKVNAADGSITFDKDSASVVSISKESSVFSLWTADPSFSNSAGTIDFSGGSPAGFTTKGTVLTIKFKAKKAGSFTTSFTKGSVLAADGKGTDVYVKGADGKYTITEAAAGEEAGEEGAVASEGTPPAPTIVSLTHPKPDSWYGTSTVDFSWKITPDITEVRTILSDKEVAIPNVSQPMTVSSQKVLAVKDGTWYVFVQFKNDLGWGEVAQRAIRIDTVQPEEFDFSLSEGETPRFVFSTEDSLSGVDRYEIMIGGSAAGTVKAADLGEGYLVPVQAGGPQAVTIKAIDKAGNVRETKKELTLPAVVKKGKVEEEVVKESPWTIELFVMILFALIIGAVASWNVYVRKMAAQEKLRILQQVSVVRDKNDKIFSAMREEFEEMVNDLDEQPQLTPRERDFMERMSEALEISEELVDSGLEELKKTIRG
ncbi:MAG: cohesin domain-containing protein [Minisyncoccia bacterium]